MENNIEGQASFLDITKNPDVSSFLEDCNYLHEPSPNEVEKIKEYFTSLEDVKPCTTEKIIAIDANDYEAKIREDIPFTNIGIVKVVNFLLEKKDIKQLQNQKFLDPFAIAKLQSNNQSYIFTFPSSNVLYKKEKNVKNSFRLKLNEIFNEFKSVKNDDSSSLMDTLFWLLKTRFKDDDIMLPKCPNEKCNKEKVKVLKIKATQLCPQCHEPIYSTDILRIWEEIIEGSQSNKSSLTRFSNVIKHILLAHYIRIIKERNPDNYLSILSNTTFVINGPLAVFGNPAPIHASLMKIIFNLNNELTSKGFERIKIIGIVENTILSSYANFIKKHIDNNTILCVSDEFRNNYITCSNIESSSTFGNETYYGQDFIYKNSKGKIKVFDVPYTFENKNDIKMFKKEKSNIDLYVDLKQYISFLNEFDSDLFDNSILPAVVCKKYSIINLQPGSKILDLLAKSKFNE